MHRFEKLYINGEWISSRGNGVIEVVNLIPVDSEEEAIAVADDSPYGLSGGVWAGHKEKGKQVAMQLSTGQVAINGGEFNHSAPIGGYKQSGNGRKLGKEGLHEFIELKALFLWLPGQAYIKNRALAG